MSEPTPEAIAAFRAALTEEARRRFGPARLEALAAELDALAADLARVAAAPVGPDLEPGFLLREE